MEDNKLIMEMMFWPGYVLIETVLHAQAENEPGQSSAHTKSLYQSKSIT